MKTALRRAVRWVRHSGPLEDADWLWDRFRGLYETALRAGSGGVNVRIGDACDVLMPPEYAISDWEVYEPAAVRALVDWIERHPSGLVLDVGCAIGIVSACALAAAPGTRVVAFDSDLASLKAAERLTSLVAGGRLRLVHGFISDVDRAGLTLDRAIDASGVRLSGSQLTGSPGTTQFVCIQSDPGDIPTYSLDALLQSPDPAAFAPTLLKMDIEGAELLALKGARRWLDACKPTLLLSVHPDALGVFGHSRDDVDVFVRGLGYDVGLLAIDHEEHWLCEAHA